MKVASATCVKPAASDVGFGEDGTILSGSRMRGRTASVGHAFGSPVSNRPRDSATQSAA